MGNIYFDELSFKESEDTNGGGLFGLIGGKLMIIKYLKSDKGRFVVRNGIVKYGLPSGISMAILYELMNVEFKLSAFNIKNIFTLYTIIFIIFFIIGGYFFGYILWHIMDLKRKKDLR